MKKFLLFFLFSPFIFWSFIFSENITTWTQQNDIVSEVVNDNEKDWYFFLNLLIYFHIIFFLILIWILIFHYKKVKNKQNIDIEESNTLKDNQKHYLKNFLKNKKR